MIGSILQNCFNLLRYQKDIDLNIYNNYVVNIQIDFENVHAGYINTYKECREAIEKSIDEYELIKKVKIILTTDSRLTYSDRIKIISCYRYADNNLINEYILTIFKYLLVSREKIDNILDDGSSVQYSINALRKMITSTEVSHFYRGREGSHSFIDLLLRNAHMRKAVIESRDSGQEAPPSVTKKGLQLPIEASLEYENERKEIIGLILSSTYLSNVKRSFIDHSTCVLLDNNSTFASKKNAVNKFFDDVLDELNLNYEEVLTQYLALKDRLLL